MEPHSDDVLVIEIGGPKWRRWMVYHSFFNCYWGRSNWWRSRRHGELWDNEVQARMAAQLARLKANQIQTEDDDE